LSAEKHDSGGFVDPVLLLGQGRFGFLAWSSNYTSQRRAAEILFAVAKAGWHRTSELDSMEPPPPPGETHSRLLNQEEKAAWIDSSLWSVSMLLLAYAIESLVKVYLVKSGVSLVNQNGALQGKFKTHKLRKLAEYAKLDLPAADLKILDCLTHFLEWRGRYPIPTKREYYDEFNKMRLGSIEEVCTSAFALCDRIFQLLNALSNEHLSAI
jgi:hypothetical protein